MRTLALRILDCIGECSNCTSRGNSPPNLPTEFAHACRYQDAHPDACGAMRAARRKNRLRAQSSCLYRAARDTFTSTASSRPHLNSEQPQAAGYEQRYVAAYSPEVGKPRCSHLGMPASGALGNERWTHAGSTVSINRSTMGAQIGHRLALGGSVASFGLRAIRVAATAR